MNLVILGGKLFLMIRISLTDLDSVMNLYKIYNLPIYNHHIGKSLKYLPEGTNLAITKDNKYVPFYQTWNLLNVLWQMDISVS